MAHVLSMIELGASDSGRFGKNSEARPAVPRFSIYCTTGESTQGSPHFLTYTAVELIEKIIRVHAKEGLKPKMFSYVPLT